MATIKLTKSGKAIQFIDDTGKVFQTSLFDYSLLVSGKKGIITPVRLPYDVNPKRFPASKIANPQPDGTWKLETVHPNHKIGGMDAYDLKKAGEEEEKKKFKETTEW